MREDHESKEIEIKQSSVTHTLHTLHDKSEKKEPRSIRIKPSHYKQVSKYAKMAGIAVGDVYTEGVNLLMQTQPIDGCVIIVENVNRKKDVQSQLRELLCIDELKRILRNVESLDLTNETLIKMKRETLLKVLKDCERVKDWGEELSELVEEAMTYFA